MTDKEKKCYLCQVDEPLTRIFENYGIKDMYFLCPSCHDASRNVAKSYEGRRSFPDSRNLMRNYFMREVRAHKAGMPNRNQAK